jgi:ABC-type uncharacterized transport system permease subunit
MIALNIVVNAIDNAIQLPIKISLTITVCTMSGLFTGFIGGAITGAVGDLFGCLLGSYAPNPVILIGSTLLGLIPGLVFDIYKTLRTKINIVSGIVLVVISQVIVFVVASSIINNFGYWYFFTSKSLSFWEYVIKWIPFKAIPSGINLILSCGLMCAVVNVPFFKDYLYFDKTKNNIEQEIKYGNDNCANNNCGEVCQPCDENVSEENSQQCRGD